MEVIDITSRLFTTSDKKELTEILRQIAKSEDLDDTELDKLQKRADILLKKAGGPEKFFKNSDSTLEDLLS